MMDLQSLFVVCAFLCNAVCFGRDSNDELHQVLIFFRHGDRAPLETYPNDPHKNFGWNGGLGGLTIEGQNRMKELGKWLRQEYGHITNYRYTPENTRVTSSIFDRCVISSKALLAGLYPHDACYSSYNCSMSERIPIEHSEKIMSRLMLLSDSCPRLVDEFEKANADEEAKRSNERRQLSQRLFYYTGRAMQTLSNMAILYSTLDVQAAAGLQLPAWANNLTMEKLKEINGESLALFTNNTVMKRLRAGPFLGRVITYMEHYARGAIPTKIYLYGVHDVTLVNLQRAMGIPPNTGNWLTPYYGGILAFELWKNKNNNGRYHVVVRYMEDSKLKRSEKLSNPLCGEPCYLDEMMSKFSNVIPRNWEEECELSQYITRTKSCF